MKITSRFLLGTIALLWEAAVLDSCREYIPNTFGFINTHEDAAQRHHPLFTGIKGMMNVAQEPDFIDLEADNTIDIEYEFVGDKNYIKPYLSNARGEVTEELTGKYKGPFVLNVPEVFVLEAKEYEFRWTIEGARLEDAYNSITDNGWYLPTNIKDESKLMKRHEFIESPSN